MKNNEKTKEQLIDELKKIQLQFDQLKKTKIENKEIEKTFRKNKEELLQSEEKLSSLFKNTPNAALHKDTKGIILNINPQFTQMFGYFIIVVTEST